MKKKLLISILLVITLFMGTILINNKFKVLAANEDVKEEIVILYESDVHCKVEGYTKLSAMKNELLKENEHVGIVSLGDFIQGGTLGLISQGEYIVNIMNIIGYDAIALGNHEFDYKISRLLELVDIMETKPVCCNFQKTGAEETIFKPYSIVSYGNVDVAYVGITTPNTLTSSTPSQFKDADGNYLYSFNNENLYDTIQKSIDDARKEGADYIVALSHMGYGKDNTQDVKKIIENTNGFDVVLDGHSHSVIENMLIIDEGGNEVILSSCGSNFEYIGKVTLNNGEISTELISTEEYDNTDAKVDSYIAKINEETHALSQRIIATSEVDLITHDENGERIIRTSETNLGNLCADAYRIITGADIGYTNGGGIRSDIKSGNITFNDILNVYPFNNTVCVAKVKGQVIKDTLEMSLMNYPNEDGYFPHVSGLMFCVNTSIPSSVIVNENEEFVSVEGPYRVYNIKIFNKDTGKYEEIKLDNEYTFASHNYLLLEQGSGMTMFKDANIILNDGMLDVELLELYLTENLNGIIGNEYKNTQNRIIFTDGEIDNKISNNKNIIIIVSVLSIIIVSSVIIFKTYRRRKVLDE